MRRSNNGLVCPTKQCLSTASKAPCELCTDMDCDYCSASSDHEEISDDYADDSPDATGELESDLCTTGCACGRVIGLNLYV